MTNIQSFYLQGEEKRLERKRLLHERLGNKFTIGLRYFYSGFKQAYPYPAYRLVKQNFVLMILNPALLAIILIPFAMTVASLRSQ